MKVISTGEKIKKLRLDIGLNQEDLTNDEITRSLISMIENNKRNLTYKTAKVIAATLNQYYLNLGKEITPDFLLETELEQAERLIKERLAEMQNLLNNPVPGNEEAIEANIQRLINFAKVWKLDSVEAELLEARGKLYYNTYQYNEALKALFKAQEHYLKEKKYDRVASCYNFIGMAYYNLALYEQALLYYKQGEEVIKTNVPGNSDVVRMDLIYNRILCYRRLKQYDLVLKEIANCKTLDYYTKEHSLNVVLVEANTYRDLGNYDKAIKVYDRLLTRHGKILADLTPLVYENYADALYRKGENEESLKLIAAALNYNGENTPSYMIHFLLKSGEIYLALGNLDGAINHVNRGIILAEKINNLDLAIELHFLYAKIQMEKEEFSIAEKSLFQLESFIKENAIPNRLIDLHIHLLLLYSRTNNFVKCSEHIEQLHELRKERR